jgi:hypothetical protein
MSQTSGLRNSEPKVLELPEDLTFKASQIVFSTPKPGK